MARKVAWLAATVVLVLLGTLGSLLTYRHYEHWLRERNSPYNQPGTVWTDAVIPMGYGTDLILLHNSTYAVTNVCDICSGEKFLRGTWREDAETILLMPAKKPANLLYLIKEQRSGCEFLRDNTPRMKNHPIFVQRSNEKCKALLLHEVTAAYDKQ